MLRRRWLLIFAFPLWVVSCGRTPSPGHSFPIQNTLEKCEVDGRLEESFWKKAQKLNGFRVDADPARIPAADTEVRLVFGENTLLVAFVCEDIKSAGANPDDDFCEISLFSRPETPFYSPFMQRLDYMNANDSVRTMRRFQVASGNGRREANVYKVGAHTPYIVDESWSCSWKSNVSRRDGGYIVETAIPWADIGGRPKPGHTFRVNFIRSRKTSGGGTETSCFNWYAGDNIRVRPFASENFAQEYPTIFATVRFDDGRAMLTRFVETEDPWRVARTQTEYERVLTPNPLPGRSAHFYLGLSSFLLQDWIRKLYDQKTWEAEETNFLEELGRAGINGPFLPAFLDKAGLRAIEELHRRLGMRFSFHGYANAAEARKAGASIITPVGTAAFFDPVYIRLKNKMLEDFLSKHGKAPWLADVWGQDEPFNQIATILQPGTYDRVNRELKETYGVELGVPPGIPSVPYQNQPVHANSRGLPDRETALSRIAVFRWLNKTFVDVARGECEIVRRLAPGKPYQPYNRNSVADMDFLDQAALWDYADSFSADPYPSFCIYVYGPARSRYHVGFTAKLVTDLAVGKPTRMIIQGCEMIQRLSTVENVREWASQAAKAGVAMIDWWGTPRLNYPDVYREMVRLSKLWKDLPALDIPSRSEIAVVFSDDSRAGAGDEALHAHYTLYTLLGEELGAWYEFISENHVRKGLQTLDGKKLIIAPELAYVSRAFAEDLLRRVEEGAVLLVLDPDALSIDIESGPLDEFRMKVLGMAACPKREAVKILPTSRARTRFRLIDSLPLCPLPIVAERRNARSIEPPPDAEVLFTYEDGSPAAYSRRVGDGEVIVFGAMPFTDSELAIQPSGWQRLLASLVDEAGISRGLPIWDFLFPATGGEIRFLDLLVTIPRN
jgi:hypothetical protein